MKITLTFKVRIFPDEECKCFLKDTMRAYRDACNYVSSFVFSTQSLELKELQKNLYYNLRTEYGLKSQMALSVLRTVRSCYKARDSRNDKWSFIKFNKPQLDLLWNRDYSISKDRFSISTLYGRLKIPFDRNGLLDKGKFGTAKLVFRHNKFFLHIPITKEIPDTPLCEINCIVGIDRGVRFLATTFDSNGKTTFFSGANYISKRNHYYELRKQLKQVGTASSKRRLRAVAQRENRWINDLNHCISKALVETYPRGTLFVLEDLNNIQSRSSKFRDNINYVIKTWPYFDLERKLTYKAAMKGQKVVKVDPAYTSQTCPLCGRKDKRSRLKKKHLFRCTTCRYKSNDDRVAAINLYSKGMQYLVQSGESMPLFGGARSIVPDAKPALETPFPRVIYKSH